MATPASCLSQSQASVNRHLSTPQDLKESRTDLTPSALALTHPTPQNPRQVQQIKLEDGLAEDIGFDMDEMYQVLFYISLWRAMQVGSPHFAPPSRNNKSPKQVLGGSSF